MSNRDGYTTIRVSNDVAKKLRMMQQGTDNTLSDIISQCLAHVKGTVVDDTENIFRETVAYDLQYYDADSSKVKLLSFRDVANSELHDTFTANNNITAKKYTNESAEVIFKDEDSVVLRITQIVVEEENTVKINNIVHISLF